MWVKQSPEEIELVERIAQLSEEADKLSNEGKDNSHALAELDKVLIEYTAFRLKRKNAAAPQDILVRLHMK